MSELCFVLMLLLCINFSLQNLLNEYNIGLKLNIEPHRIAAKLLENKTIKCVANIEYNRNISSLINFDKPSFQWTFYHKSAIKSTNSNCSFEQNECWNEIVIQPDLRMRNNSPNDSMQIYCDFSISIKKPEKQTFKINNQTHASFKMILGNRYREKCTSNNDCSSEENMECRSQVCECKLHNNTINTINDKYIPINDEYNETTCVKAARLGEKCKYSEQCSAFDPIFTCGKSSKRCECEIRPELSHQECNKLSLKSAKEDKSRTTTIPEYNTVINESENEGYFTFDNVNAILFITGAVAIILLFITITTIFLVRRKSYEIQYIQNTLTENPVSNDNKLNNKEIAVPNDQTCVLKNISIVERAHI